MIAQFPIYLAAVILFAFGIRYLATREFMAYHADITGKQWSELDRGMQTAMLGMLKICGTGFLTYGVVVVWFIYALSRGETWAAWAILTTAPVMLVPILLITLWLRRFAPKAKTPVAAPAIVLALLVVGAVASLA